MYGWVWRALPGPTWFRAASAAIALLLVVAVLFTWAFPAVAALVPLNDGTVG